MSVDALFGLPRKKAAGTSHRDPLHGDLFFGSQTAVDEYVASYQTGQKMTKACSNFLAGDSLRSSRRYHALDETALFGCACRHEFPRLFISLKHGERLSYVVWLLEELTQHVPAMTNIYVMYDIACTLVRHLKASRNGAHLLERIKFALPSFHAFGHNAACQVVYSPVRCEGVGLSDGEVMERMWSYLRRFSRMTKEMRPAHRVDVLSHALLYYGHMTKQKLPSLLTNRWIKANRMNSIAKQTFQLLNETLSGICKCTIADVCMCVLIVSVTDAMVEGWIKGDLEVMTSGVMEQTLTTEWKDSYYHILRSYYIAKEQLNRGGDISAIREKFFSLDSRLADMERRCGVTTRWRPTDKEYVDTRRASLMERKKQVHTSLWSSVVKRHYLLKMKAKYADGQKIAKKLCCNITKETKRVKTLLEDYNSALFELQTGDLPVSMSEILSLSSDFWADHLTSNQTDSQQIPLKAKEEITQAYFMIQRSDEEITLLRADMLATIKYWSRRRAIITDKLVQLATGSSSENLYLRGSKCLLQRLRWDAELHQVRATAMFSQCIDLPDTIILDSNVTHDSVSSDGFGSDTDTDLEVDTESDDGDNMDLES